MSILHEIYDMTTEVIDIEHGPKQVEVNWAKKYECKKCGEIFYWGKYVVNGRVKFVPINEEEGLYYRHTKFCIPIKTKYKSPLRDLNISERYKKHRSKWLKESILKDERGW